MARLDPHEGFEILKGRVTKAIESNFPREGSAHTLELEGVQIEDDLDMNDIAGQKKAKLSGTTFGIPVKATMVLKDKGTGKVIEKKTLKVATLPKYTRRHSFIVKGSEYQVDNQWRLKPGIYTRVAQNGELQSRFNFQGKQALDMTFDPKTKVFRMKHGGSKPPLYPILKAVGIDDDTMQAAWGKDILNANKTTVKGKALNVDKLAIGFAKRLDPRAEVKTFGDASDVINAYMGDAELREDVTKLTLGKAFKKITPDVLTRSSKRLLGVARGEQKPDVRDALMFKDLLSTEDFIAERMGEGTKTIQRRIGNNLDRKDTIREIVGPDVFDRPIREFFSKSSLASTPQQINPLEMLSGQQRTTITGEGGVKDAHKIMEEAKLVDPSHFGILDALHTPESVKTGISLHLCTSAVKRGKTVALPLVNVKTGKTELLDPKEISEQVIAMPDEGRWKDGKWKPKGAIVKASVQGNEIREVKSKDVKYVMKNTGQMFSLATNMVPFLNSDSPNRSTMAGRHMEQAIPLKNPEAPLVQSDRGDGRTYDEFVGRYASHEAPVAGKVTKIEPGAIHIKGTDGKSQQIQIYDNYPLNDKKGVFHSTPVVKVGQQVKKGDLISDSNFTQKGVYAPGTNLRSVSGDTTVFWITESAVDRVRIADADVSERAWSPTYGLSTRSTEILPVKSYIAHATKERMLEITSWTGRTVRVTENHSMVTLGDDGDLVKVKASEIRDNTFLPRLGNLKLPVKCREVLISSPRYDLESVPLNEDFGWLVGIYAAEGYCARTRVQIAASEPCVKERVVACLHSLWPNLEVKQTETTVEIYYAPLAHFFRDECGHLAPNKKLPACTWGAPEEFRRGVLSGYWTGDGTVSKTKPNGSADVIAFSVSKELRDQIADLCLTLGIDTSLVQYPGAKGCRAIFGARVMNRCLHIFPEMYHPKQERLSSCLDKEVGWGSSDMTPLFADVMLPFRELLRQNYGGSLPKAKAHVYRRGYLLRADLLDELQSYNGGDWALDKLKVLAESDIYWDRVREVKEVGYESWVYDLDMGENPNFSVSNGLVVHNTAYSPWKGLNFEDGVIISDTAATKLTSNHLYKKSLLTQEAQAVGLKKFMANKSTALTKDQMGKLGDDGIIKPGLKVTKGDTLIAALSEKAPTTEAQMLKNLHRSLANPYDNRSVTWDQDYEGEVVAVNTKGKAIQVHVRTAEPMQVGDKLSNRHGGKGIVSRILPDHEMPQTEDGAALEVVMNPIGIAGRLNVGQVLETAAGKLAKKTGKTYKIQNFGEVDNRTKVEQDLKRAKISDKETIIDPINNKKVPGVLVGDQYIIKLQHQVDKKMMARSRAGYDRNLIPKGGGAHGAQALGSLGLYAMLSHGSKANIREMATLKSDKAQADEVWSALQAGEPIPPPQTTFAYKKFEGYLKGMGVNVEKDGNSLNLMPLTDKQVLEMSNGELKDAGRAIRGYTIGSQKPGSIEPEKSGLFDPHVTGGLDGMKWCLHPSTRVITDQGLLPIGKIVKEQLQVKVLSQSPVGKLEWKEIYNYWKNKVNVDLVSLQYKTRGHLSGYQRCSSMTSTLWCTPGHEIYTSNGKVHAKNAEGTVAVLASHSLSKAQEQLVLGSLLEDAYLNGGSDSRNWMFRCSHGPAQLEYLETKTEMAIGSAPVEFVASAIDSFIKLRALVGSKLNDLYGNSAPSTTPVVIDHVDQSGTKRFSKCRTVYNIEVEGNHNYFANGILVGNSHLSLAEPLPNPVFEKAVKSVAGIRGPQFNRLISGEEGVTEDGTIVPKGTKGATFGPQSIGRLLDTVDVEGDLKKAEARLPGLKNQPLNEARKEVKYLRALKKLDMSPRDAYMMQKVPVMPPAMRPLSTTSAGDLQFDDLNQLYKDVALLDQQLREQPSYSPESIKAEPRAELYDRMQALTGMGGSLKDRYKGIANIISGDSPKFGFVQDKLIKRKQDLTMRSTIIPEPSLSLDDIAIPRKAATELYKPFVVREMRMSTGMGPLTAKQMVEGDPDHALVKSSLQRVVEERPLLVKRDPALHKYNIQAFKPKLVEGKAIKIHPLICSGFGADFNGDSCKPSESLMIRLNNVTRLTTFGGLASILLPGATEEDQIELAGEGTAVLELEGGLEVLSWIPDVGIQWRPVNEFTIHTSHGGAFEVTTHIGRKVTVSEHHNFGVVGQDLVCKKIKTDEMEKGMLVPFIRKMPVVDCCAPEIEVAKKLSLPNNFRAGWFCGYFAGNGSITGRSDTVLFACKDDSLHPLLKSIFDHIGLSSQSKSGKGVYSTNKDWATALKSLFGYTPSNKRVPDFVFETSEDFRAGFVSGLIDAKGSIHSDTYKALHVQVRVSSNNLSDGMCWLLASLGIGAYRRRSKRATAKTSVTYILEISRDDLETLPALLFENKATLLYELLNRPRKIIRSRYDLVPFSIEVANLLIDRGKCKGLKPDLLSKSYESGGIRKCGELGYVTRRAAERIIHRYGRIDNPTFSKWLSFVEDKSTSWTLVTAIEGAERPPVMYDFSVPQGNETFAVAGGLITRNTMSAYVPMTSEAVDEAHKMLPSRILFNPATAKVMYTPTHEAQVGLFMKSEVGKSTRLRFKDQKELQAAVKAGKLEAGDAATVGKFKTTLDRMQIDAALPKKLQGGKLLTDMKYRFTKGEQNRLFDEMARADKNGYAQNIDRMKDMGNLKATHGGFSFGLEDFKVHKEIRDPLLQEAARKTAKLDLDKSKDMEKFVEVYEGAMKSMATKLKAQAKTGKNPLDKLEVSAGIKGKGYVQLTGAPVLFVDAKGDVVPSPVKRSYSEGLGAADYWAAASGGRKGVVQKVQSVSEPGYLTKLMMNSTMDTLVSEEDCGTSKGISLSLDEPDIVGRYTTSNVKAGRTTIPVHTMITPEVVSKMRNSKVSRVLVRSPMRCDHAKGVCKGCLGLDSNGELHDLGTNIGVLSAQAIGERGTQLAMRAFHCNHAKSLVTVCNRAEQSPITVSLEHLFDLVDAPVREDEHGEFKRCGSEDCWLIYDGTWQDLEEVRRHVPDRPMIMVSDGAGVTICQDNHPVAARPNLVSCERCGYHRLKDPGRNASIKNGKWYCPKCGRYQLPPKDRYGTIEFPAARELQPERFYLERDLLPDTWGGNIAQLDIDPYVAGMYVAEGSIGYRWTNPNKVRKPYSFTISQKPGRIRDKLESRLPKEWGARLNSRYIEVHSLELGTLFEATFGRYSRNVSLPPTFLRFDNTWLSDFLCGLLDGDGSKKADVDGADRIAIDTTSFELAQQVVKICAKLGIVSNLHATTNRELTRNQAFRVVLRVTRSGKDLLSESIKMERVEKLSPDQEVDIRGPHIMTSCRDVLYTNHWVYDVKTRSGLFVASGLLNHNSGGLFEGREAQEKSISGGGLDRALTILHMPKKVKGSAKLSTASGKVGAIKKDPAGGVNVTIGDTSHYIPADRNVLTKMKRGATVKKGDPITAGPINPHELLPLTNMNKVQGYLASELHSIYAPEGIRRRNSEVIVRSLSNVTKVENPGDNDDFIVGDFAPTSVVNDWNKKNRKLGRLPVRHSPVLRGVKQIPLDVQTDWLARLNHENLRGTIVEAAQQGWASQLHGDHPIPPLIYGAEFGKGTKKKPWSY